MNILLHSCCGPCTIYPAQVLEQQGHEFTAFFHNPNIHPFREFKKRLSTFQEFVKAENIPFEVESNYGLQDFVRQIAFNELKKCFICYRLRLAVVAESAKQNGYDAFTTTLLYSRYQKHTALMKICSEIASTTGIDFYYHDFREGWQHGIDESISRGMYRQPYCGCIFSEQERYDKKFRKKK